MATTSDRCGLCRECRAMHSSAPCFIFRAIAGPFHKSFSSVVGPNGSGKSNVIDAMLFVFGKKANKLRMNKVRAPRMLVAALSRIQLPSQAGQYPRPGLCEVPRAPPRSA